MNKILVTIYVLSIETQYDLMIPINLTVKEVMDLIQESISELSSKSYVIKQDAVLYDEEGKVINDNNIVKFSGLKNGSRLLLV
jgi:uncharacterized ubiquitin-like protein YukD